MSLFWSNTGWGGERYYNSQVVSWLKSDWNANLVRAAMGVEDEGGYLTDSSNKDRLIAVVDAAIANNMYVIIDWHTHTAENYRPQAIAFFKEMATRYGQYNNVIYEIYNEPLNVSWSNTIKPYAEAVIAEIRAIDPDNLIIVGTPNWSQDVDIAANDPITRYSNIAYTLHFYAATTGHQSILRDKAQTALNRGIPLFVTEWGSVAASGDGGVNNEQTTIWINFLNSNGISHANWALNDKDEGASALKPNASINGGWSNNDLTTSGLLVRNLIRTQNTASSSSLSSSTASISSSAISSSNAVSSSAASSGITNIALNGDVENGTINWTGRNAQVARSTADKRNGNGSLLVSNRSADWHGATFSLGQLTVGSLYEISAWVKMAPGSNPGDLKITAKRTDDNDPNTYLEYTEVGRAYVTSSNWVQISGSYTFTGETAFEALVFESLTSAANASFYIDDLIVSGRVDSTTEPPQGDKLKDWASIPLGVAVATSGTASIYSSTPRATLVKANFDQITAENSMKMRYMYSSGTTFSFTDADYLLNWATSNGLAVHAHALVWHPHYQLPDWARSPTANFKNNYTNHITTVATRFKGKVASWDVVNEALFDGNDNSENLPGANGYRQSVFYQQYNGPEYIDTAFNLAHAADPAALLYYNDFNTENNSDKTTALVSLVQRLQNNNVPIHGVGFQMHVLSDWPSIANIRASWQKIVDLRPKLKLKLTELDVRVNNIYDNNTNNDVTSCSDAATLTKQKARYKEIIQAYYEVVPADQRGGITLWGIADPDSWFANLTRSDNVTVPGCPLLFDGNLQPKPAYDGFREALYAKDAP